MSTPSKRFMLANIKCLEIPTIPVEVSNEVFDIDRKIDEMLVIMDEMQKKYHSEDATTHFFKARLTSGSCSTLPWIMDDNEESEITQ